MLHFPFQIGIPNHPMFENAFNNFLMLPKYFLQEALALTTASLDHDTAWKKGTVAALWGIGKLRPGFPVILVRHTADHVSDDLIVIIDDPGAPCKLPLRRDDHERRSAGVAC